MRHKDDTRCASSGSHAWMSFLRRQAIWEAHAVLPSCTVVAVQFGQPCLQRPTALFNQLDSVGKMDLLDVDQSVGAVGAGNNRC